MDRPARASATGSSDRPVWRCNSHELDYFVVEAEKTTLMVVFLQKIVLSSFVPCLHGLSLC